MIKSSGINLNKTIDQKRAAQPIRPTGPVATPAFKGAFKFNINKLKGTESQIENKCFFLTDLESQLKEMKFVDRNSKVIAMKKDNIIINSLESMYSLKIPDNFDEEVKKLLLDNGFSKRKGKKDLYA